MMIDVTKNRFLPKMDKAHVDIGICTGILASDVWRDKYRWEGESSYIDTAARVVSGIYALDTEEYAQEAFEAISAGLWVPAGRILAGAGTPKRVTLMNCMHGSTKFFDGSTVITLAEAFQKGGKFNVLTQAGYAEATVEQFGRQKLNNITLAPVKRGQNNFNCKYHKVVQATPDHRWYLSSGKVTTSLAVGDRIPAVTHHTDGERYLDGFKHGLIFGDGQLHRVTKGSNGHYPVGMNHYVLRLCGEKAKYLTLFNGENVKFPPAAKGDPIVYLHSMHNWKNTPKVASPDYIKGFIDGWFAADGHTSSKHISAITTTNLEAVSWFEDYISAAGYIQTGKYIRRKAGFQTNLGTLKNDLWEVQFRPADLMEWIVTDIQDSGLEELVYCAVVPEGSQFTLAGGILTGNCYVNAMLQDSMESILSGISYAALTMQQGGGIGTDFSPIRPEGAILKRTHTKASGPLPFMDMWHAMCDTIRSAGDRRGAMMGTMCDTHPDLPKFIVAKQALGKLTNFNVSILVSDALMDAVKEDEDWFLHFHEPPFERLSEMEQYDFIDDDGIQQYVYSRWKARDLWELITRNTYEWSEPGVIFIDRINELNNLHYCEDIRCTNPCGEQPLPPHGTCNLGAVNLSRLVKYPFTPRAEFDWDLLKEIVRIGIRFLDNVIDVTRYPLKEQEEEEINKRRLGLGFTGLADAIAQMTLRYGSLRSAEFAENVQYAICMASYEASINLAKERGSFPLFNADEYLAPHTFAGKFLPRDFHALIRTTGIRNGVLLTVAPTGTTSLVVDNPASGIEPIFLHQMQRKVRQGDNTWKPYTEWAYSANLYRRLHGDVELPSYMVTANDLTIEEHILIQGRIQRWVDASVSKTINVAEDCSYEDFVRVYELAYTSGCKGCTTYRPSAVRGSILSSVSSDPEKPNSPTTTHQTLRPRPDALSGTTYKVKWPRRSAALYLTINSDEDATPHEIFIASKDATNAEWTTSLSIMITAIFRKGGNVDFIADELQQVQSMNDGAWMPTKDGKSKYFGSLPAYLGYLIGQHLNPQKEPQIIPMIHIQHNTLPDHGEFCPNCSAPAVVHQEGCKKCTSCGWSECN